MTLKYLFNQITHQQEILGLQERHTIKDLEITKEISFIDNHTVGIFLLVAGIICY